MKEIEMLARGVMVRDGQVLVCRNRRKRNTFLPGGHIEVGEPAKTALVREIREEMGLPATAGRFLGAAEHTFVYGDRRTCEINLVFALTVRGLRPGTAAPSKEEKLEFFWMPLSRLVRSGLEPAVLRREIPRWLKGRERHWASTYPRA